MLVQVGLEYRYMPPVAKLIEIVKGGTLGHVKMVAIREHRFPFLVKVCNETLSTFTVWQSILQTFPCDRSTIGTGSMLTRGEHL